MYTYFYMSIYFCILYNFVVLSYYIYLSWVKDSVITYSNSTVPNAIIMKHNELIIFEIILIIVNLLNLLYVILIHVVFSFTVNTKY